ncbi:hypothetical protein G6F22_015743 [Rhizopus arrhizus]|nr:hypothetical protein G6F22_015743 [Rhizopus arrhizus]
MPVKRRPDIAQKDEQDDDDQRRALQQVLLDGGDGLVDQVGAVVDGHRLHALRQRLVDGVQPRGHGLRDAAAVLSDQHEHRAQHDFFAVVGGRARAQFAPNPDVRDVADPDGLALHGSQDDVLDVVDRTDLARRADQVLLAIALDVACAHVGVVAVQRRHHVRQRQAVGRQPLGAGRHLGVPSSLRAPGSASTVQR